MKSGYLFLDLEMKGTKKIAIILLVIIFLLKLDFNPAYCQALVDQQKVTVIAAEIPVRVYFQGEPLRGLTIDDFELWEDGVQQQIRKLEFFTKKIEESPPQREKNREVKRPRRVFLLIFNIFDYQESMGQALDEFLGRYFQPGNQIMVLIENRLLVVDQELSLEELIQVLKSSLRKYKQISTMKFYRTFHHLNLEAEKLLLNLRGNSNSGVVSQDQAIINFYNNYLNTWRDFKRQFIIPDLDVYQQVGWQLQNFKGEKWAVCFQQRELFPKLKKMGSLNRTINELINSQTAPRAQTTARFIRAKQWELQREFDLSPDFYWRKVKNIFLSANITFHLLLLKSTRTLASPDFELREVAQDYENSLKQLAVSTGGYMGFSNNLGETLNAAVKKEDYYYLLVYYPQQVNPGEERQIEIKVKREGVEVVHQDKIFLHSNPGILIKEIVTSNKILRFSLNNYVLVKKNEHDEGLVQVKITIFNEKSEKVYEDLKSLSIFKKKTSIGIPFKWFPSGQYLVIIEARDFYSGKSTVVSHIAWW